MIARFLTATFSRRLILFVLFATIPAMLGGTWILSRKATDDLRVAGVQRLASTAENLANRVNNWVEDVARDLQLLSRHPNLPGMDPRRQRELLQQFRKIYPQVTYAHTIGPNGINVARSDGKPAIDYHDRKYFRRAMAGAPIVRETILRSRSTGHPALNQAAPILDPADKVLGVVVVGMDLDALDDVVGVSHYGRTGYSCLVDEQGRELAHPDLTCASTLQCLRGLPPVQGVLRERVSRSYRFQDEQGIWWLAYAVPLTNGWSVVSFEEEAEVLAEAHQVFVLAMLVMGVVTVVMISLTWLATRMMVQPIVSMTDTAIKIANGDWMQRIPEDREDELGTLARAFNKMVGQLELTYRSVEEKVAQLSAALTERKQMEDELHKAKDAADAANRAKSQFLANMSHEIRTPMTAILGYVDLMLDENVGRATREHVAVIKRNSEHLLGLINDILDFSKIEADKLQIEPTRCSLVQLVAEVVSTMRPQAAVKQLKLKMELSGPLPETVLTDPLRLRQVLVNLVGNAIKFTDQGEVRLAARLTGENGSPRLHFDVIDTGIGMNEEQVKKLFQPFTQHDNSSTRKFGGTGLGLCISKHLAEAMGGTIEVCSELGKGSTFRITIDPGPLTGVQMIQNAQESLLDRPASATAAPTDKIVLRGRILLAEDGPDNQRLICLLLRKAGADVTTVENGQLAIEAALAAREAGEPFDVILMDMQMPVLDGYAATQQLRKQGYTAPIVALTAHAMADDSQKCLDGGCDGYASKPIDRQRLLATVAPWLARGRTHNNSQKSSTSSESKASAATQ